MQDRHEDGLAVLALAAESHAAVRSRAVGVSGVMSSVYSEGDQDCTVLHCQKKNVEDCGDSATSESDNALVSHTSTPYRYLGFEEEDDDD